jgi:hypothetical protein
MEQLRDSTADAATTEDNFTNSTHNASKAADELAGHAVQLSEVIESSKSCTSLSTSFIKCIL